MKKRRQGRRKWSTERRKRSVGEKLKGNEGEGGQGGKGGEKKREWNRIERERKRKGSMEDE